MNRKSGPTPMTIPEKFWRHANANANASNGCWLWSGSLSLGYGVITVGHRSKKLKAHRVSWQLHFGDIPSGMFVCHRCDVPACVNPLHLFLGTNRDNLEDMTRKGRRVSPERSARRGTENGRAILCEDDVQAIRHLCSSKTLFQKSIAVIFQVSEVTIEHISRKVKWRHLPDAVLTEPEINQVLEKHGYEIERVRTEFAEYGRRRLHETGRLG